MEIKKGTFGETVALIRADKHYGVGHYMELAKGKNEFTTSFKEGLYKAKRRIKCR